MLPKFGISTVLVCSKQIARTKSNDRHPAVIPNRNRRDSDHKAREMTPIDIEIQIARITKKLKYARLKLLNCFGSESHGFRLNKPLDEHALKLFEMEQNIKLPPGFRTFLKMAGNGGAGPYYGIYPLDKSDDFVGWAIDDAPSNLASLPSPLHPAMQRDDDWETQFADNVSPYQGLISIGSQGCSYEIGLIVTGEYVGRVVYLDAEGQAPYVVREPDFLSWYERWLDELHGGYDMHWFGFGIGGDESKLIAILKGSQSIPTEREDALWAIRRLPKLSSDSKEEVCKYLDDVDADVRAAACSVAGKFKIDSAREQVRNLLGDSSVEVRKSAIATSTSFTKIDYEHEVIELLRADEAEVAKRAFFRLNEKKKISRALMLELVESSPHGSLRYLIAHAIKWKKKDEAMLIRLLMDDHPQVRSCATLGLRSIRSNAGLLPAIELLHKESDQNAIDSVLRMLGEIPDERNSEVLMRWVHANDDFHRLAAVESLCKLGDMNVVPIAQAMLKENRKPVRLDETGFPRMSSMKSIARLVEKSLRSSPNRKLRKLVSWFGW